MTHSKLPPALMNLWGQSRVLGTSESMASWPCHPCDTCSCGGQLCGSLLQTQRAQAGHGNGNVPFCIASLHAQFNEGKQENPAGARLCEVGTCTQQPHHVNPIMFLGGNRHRIKVPWHSTSGLGEGSSDPTKPGCIHPTPKTSGTVCTAAPSKASAPPAMGKPPVM